MTAGSVCGSLGVRQVLVTQAAWEVRPSICTTRGPWPHGPPQAQAHILCVHEATRRPGSLPAGDGLHEPTTQGASVSGWRETLLSPGLPGWVLSASPGDLASFLAAHLLASVAVPLLCHRSPEPHPLTPQEDSAGLRATLRRGLEASPCREVTGTCVTPTCSHPCHF